MQRFIKKSNLVLRMGFKKEFFKTLSDVLSARFCRVLKYKSNLHFQKAMSQNVSVNCFYEMPANALKSLHFHMVNTA